MEKEKLIRQLFIGKVSDIIGINKTYELLKEAKNDLESIKETNNKPEIETFLNFLTWAKQADLDYSDKILIKDFEKFFNKNSDSICEKDTQIKEYKEKENKKYCSCHQSFKIQEVEDGDLICEFCRKLIKQ